MTVRNFEIAGWEAGVSCAYEGSTVADNNITQTENAVAIYGQNCTVSANVLTDSIYGVYIEASGTTVAANQIVDNYGGVLIYPSVGTVVKMNSFAGNKVEFTIGHFDTIAYQIYENNIQIDAATDIVETTADQLGPADTGSMPPFDNGSIGNYWSNYAAKYPSAAPVGNSTIGDAPYVIRSGPSVTDRYPLMTPVSIQVTSQPSSGQAANGNPSTAISKTDPSGSPQSPGRTTFEVSLAAAAAIAVASCIVVLAFRSKLFWLKEKNQPA